MSENGIIPAETLEKIKRDMMAGGAVIKTPAEKEAELKRSMRVRDFAVTVSKLAAGCDINEFLSALVVTRQQRAQRGYAEFSGQGDGAEAGSG